MKKLFKTFRWFVEAWYSLWNIKPQNLDIIIDDARFKIEYAEDLPEHIPENIVFIIQDGNVPELLAFKCPCGCNDNIFLNLLEDARPRWEYTISNKNLIDIQPSIWRKVGCKSHFFLTKGIIKWV